MGTRRDIGPRGYVQAGGVGPIVGSMKWLAVLLLALAGCATYYARQLDQLYGVPDPARYDRPAPAATGRQTPNPASSRSSAVCKTQTWVSIPASTAFVRPSPRRSVRNPAAPQQLNAVLADSAAGSR